MLQERHHCLLPNPVELDVRSPFLLVTATAFAFYQIKSEEACQVLNHQY